MVLPSAVKIRMPTDNIQILGLISHFFHCIRQEHPAVIFVKFSRDFSFANHTRRRRSVDRFIHLAKQAVLLGYKLTR